MKRSLLAALWALLLVCALAAQVCAAEPVDMSRTGSISITMSSQGEPVPGGTLTLIRVAVVTEDDGNYGFAFTVDFAGCGLTLENLTSQVLADGLADYARTNGIEGLTREIGENGETVFADLELGLYLLMQETPAEGYCLVSPFLVSVPVSVDGAYVYDVDASPKTSVEPEPTESTEPPPTTEPEPTDPKLPQTGQTNWPVPVLAVSGILIFMLGWYMNRTGRKDRYES